VGDTPFFSQEIENTDILGYFGHLVAQKVTKYSKNRSKNPFNVVLKCFKLLLAIFRSFVNFLPIFVDFLLSKIIFERVGVLLFCLKGWGLNSDP
jgi:hypothetical protein